MLMDKCSCMTLLIGVEEFIEAGHTITWLYSTCAIKLMMIHGQRSHPGTWWVHCEVPSVAQHLGQVNSAWNIEIICLISYLQHSKYVMVKELVSRYTVVFFGIKNVRNLCFLSLNVCKNIIDSQVSKKVLSTIVVTIMIQSISTKDM